MSVKLPIYMDNHATTPVDPRVMSAMLPYFNEKFGNAASRNHSFGWAAEEAVESARGQLARLINAAPKEMVFTSGATGSNSLAMTGHKSYGPKGCGALYVRRRNPRVQLASIIDGGGHERGMRSGTLNVPGIVGFGKAAELCQNEMAQEGERLRALRERLKEGIFKGLDEVYINGSMAYRLPNNLNVSFAYAEGESLLMGINDVAVSSGSACTSAKMEPSYVLKALGVGEDLAHSSIRFGLGRFNTQEEVDYVIQRVVEVVNRVRELSPLYEMAKERVHLSKTN